MADLENLHRKRKWHIAGVGQIFLLATWGFYFSQHYRQSNGLTFRKFGRPEKFHLLLTPEIALYDNKLTNKHLPQCIYWRWSFQLFCDDYWQPKLFPFKFWPEFPDALLFVCASCLLNCSPWPVQCEKSRRASRRSRMSTHSFVRFAIQSCKLLKASTVHTHIKRRWFRLIVGETNLDIVGITIETTIIQIEGLKVGRIFFNRFTAKGVS